MSDASSDNISNDVAPTGTVSASTKRSSVSFRRRLLMTLGPVLTIALILMGVVVWLFAYSWLTYSEQSVLDYEIEEVSRQVVRRGRIAVERYSWNEPHHRFDAAHIDPYFLQIFDNQGRLLRASANIALFGPDVYPNRLLAYQTEADRWMQGLRVFEVGDQQLYYRTRAITNNHGTLLGYVQVARYDPGISVIMRRTTWIILAGLIPVLMSLLGLVWWSARRVVGPLEQITQEASELSPDRLEARIAMPAKSDSETVLLANTLNNLLGQLEQSFNQMQRFTSDAAHELQTPLTILKGHVSVALRRERTAESYRETLHVLQEQIEGLIHLVHCLLQLTRLEREDRFAEPEPVDLVRVVHQSAAFFEKAAIQKGLTFAMDMPAEAMMIGYESFVKEVVVNLLENAVKYTEQGQVRVEVVTDEKEVTLYVRDTGVGMQEDVLEHATDRFYRAPTSNVANIPGSGLGLALVAQIVARLNGELNIASKAEEGTEVRVRFNAA